MILAWCEPLLLCWDSRVAKLSRAVRLQMHRDLKVRCFALLCPRRMRHHFLY